jgi:hypothetical protein
MRRRTASIRSAGFEGIDEPPPLLGSITDEIVVRLVGGGRRINRIVCLHRHWRAARLEPLSLAGHLRSSDPRGRVQAVADSTVTFLILGAVVLLFITNRIPVAIVAVGTSVSLWAPGSWNSMLQRPDSATRRCSSSLRCSW